MTTDTCAGDEIVMLGVVGGLNLLITNWIIRNHFLVYEYGKILPDDLRLQKKTRCCNTHHFQVKYLNIFEVELSYIK